MMRVPMDAENPTFDHTFKVSAMKWFFGSSTAQRKEWLRRRQAAAELARLNQNKRTEEFVQQKIAGVALAAQEGLARRVANGQTSQQQADHTMARIRQAAQEAQGK